MNVASPRSLPAGMDEAEWGIRCDLAALYRLVAHHRMTDFIYTHISARLPGPAAGSGWTGATGVFPGRRSWG